MRTNKMTLHIDDSDLYNMIKKAVRDNLKSVIREEFNILIKGELERLVKGFKGDYWLNKHIREHSKELLKNGSIEELRQDFEKSGLFFTTARTF